MTSLTIIGIYLAILLLLGVSSNRMFRGTSLDYMLAVIRLVRSCCSCRFSGQR